MSARSLFVCALAFLTASAGFAAGGAELRVLSGRPDMVTGGDALIEAMVPAGVTADKVTLMLNGHDAGKVLKTGKHPNVLIGRVDGLAAGKNTLELKAGKGSAKLDVTNYPITGPVFSGTHQKPFVCQTEQAGFGPAIDTDCSVKSLVSYIYKSTEPQPAAAGGRGRGGPPPVPGAPPAGYKNLDPAGSRPGDIAKTTTSDGRTVDYIVRRERGTINRAIYEIAILHDPAKPAPDPLTMASGWNGRLVYSFGGGCAAGYRQGLPGSALSDAFLGQGYAVAVSSLNVFGTTCDDVISGETMMMVKEHFTKEFGVPVHTMGTGGSGGAIQQYMIAQNYPGLLDGLMPNISFPDNAIFEDVIDCALLNKAYNSAKYPFNDDQKAAVSGFATWKTCSTGWLGGLAANQVEATACNSAIPKALQFDPVANRNGARCDYFDNDVNVYGKDPKTGAARKPLDNVGVQYGLKAFNAGQINADQFLELNEIIGGHDVDGNIIGARDIADPAALKIAYQSGRVNTGGGSLSYVPIIDNRAYGDPSGNLHDRFRSVVTRARLKAANGSADNQVILMFPSGVPAAVRPNDMVLSLDKWLDNIDKDTSRDSPAKKVARNKPVDLVDACWTDKGEKIAETITFNDRGRCNELYPAHADARIVAGAPLADDILKCSLKSIDAKDYTRPLTAEQMSRLKAAFPQGVCDYNRPGVSQQRVDGTWHRY